MSGGLRLFWMVASLLFPALLLAAAVYASDGSSSSSPAAAVSSQGPLLAEPKPLAETLHGTRIVDNYRWLEDGKNPETQKWVDAEMSYTRAVLDPLPGREQIHKRLTELLTIGNINVPQIGGKYYFYTRRDGMQNQPVLYVREGLNGQDRVVVDANQLAADLSGDAHDRRRVHHRRRNAGDHVRRTGAGRRNRDADLAGRARVAVSHMGRTLLVPHEHVSNRVREHRVVGRKDRAARVPEHVGHAFPDERFPQDLSAGQFHKTFRQVHSSGFTVRSGFEVQRSGFNVQGSATPNVAYRPWSGV